MTDTTLHPLTGTYSWAFGSTPEQIFSREAQVLQVIHVYGNYRVIGITSDLHFFRTSVGLWKRDMMVATAEDWRLALIAQEYHQLVSP